MVMVNFSESAIFPLPLVLKYYLSFLVESTDPDMACHHGGNNGTSVVGTAPSGSQVLFDWTNV